ncbi:Bud site selection protein 6 [Favolaschia claudopus]|uniref:Bud site selection protein 6 n=1 Tax=Favolaschia claudopus TaxID=2862362 RepID=A0AAW0DVQ2_9AGAR
MHDGASASRSSTSSANTSNGSQGGYVALRPGDVSSAVRTLLVSTKDLQKILIQWSLGQVSETDVSDVYVQIGTDFNATIQAFAYHRIEMSEIHSIPQDLRGVLEQCLAEDPSPEVLAIFMPEIREVIFKLLRGLQSKQHAWKSRASRGRGVP